MDLGCMLRFVRVNNHFSDTLSVRPLIFQNNQQVAAADGVGYDFYGVATVICSVVGTWWGVRL
jgi:hypothetical protein